MGKLGAGKWLLALGDRISGQALVELLSQQEQVVAAYGAHQALALVQQMQPDYLAVDLALPGMDVPAFLEKVSALPINALPWCICLYPPGAQAMAQRARQAGACVEVEKPVDAALLQKAVQALGPMDRLPRRQKSLEEIQRMLWALGFSPAMKGTGYLARAILLCSRDVSLTGSLTRDVYPLVARLSGAAPDQVQHAIRRSVETAWAKGPRDRQYHLFGNTIDAKRGKPTGGEMIARMAELLRTGMEIE